MASISIENVRKLYGAIEAIRGVSIDIAVGEFVILVGPSGCGKSTLFGDGCGLEVISNGVIRIGAKPGDRIRRSTKIDQICLFDGATGGHLAP